MPLTEALAFSREFTGQSKNFKETQTSFKRLVDAADRKTAAGDMALIFGFMKTQDPTSTVREGEFATAENARGWSDVVRASYNKAKDGTRLVSEQRADFLQTAGMQYLGQVAEQRSRRDEYQSLADQYKVPESALPGIINEKLVERFASLAEARQPQVKPPPDTTRRMPMSNPDAMSGTDAPGAGMMQPRSAASGAIGGGEPLGGAPGPAQYQYGQPGPGQPRGEFDMLAAGGLTTPGYGTPAAGPAGEGTTGTVPPPPGLAQSADLGRFTRSALTNFRLPKSRGSARNKHIRQWGK